MGGNTRVTPSFTEVIIQIPLLDVVFSLVVEVIHVHIPKGYIYFVMGFSVMVEMLNLQLRRKTKPLELGKTYTESPDASH